MATVLRIADAVDDVRYGTVLDCLEEATERNTNGYKASPEFRATGCIVIVVDQNDGKYHVKRHCSSMKTSELIALLEIVKQQELRLLEPCTGE